MLLTLLLWRLSCLCSFESVFFSDLENEPRAFAGVNNLQTLCLGLCLFFLLLNQQDLSGRQASPLFNTLPSYIPPRTAIPTDCGTYLCLPADSKAIQFNLLPTYIYCGLFRTKGFQVAQW